jgi:hypothetical protein
MRKARHLLQDDLRNARNCNMKTLRAGGKQMIRDNEKLKTFEGAVCTNLLHACLMDFECTTMGAITSNNIQLTNVLGFDEIENLLHVETTSRRTQDGSSLMVDVFHVLGIQYDGRCLRSSFVISRSLWRRNN